MFWWKSFWRVFLKSQYRRFPVNFAKYFRKHFCRTPPVDCFCLIPFVKSNILLFVTSISATKCYFDRYFFCWFISNIFRANTVDRLHVAASGIPRQRVVDWYIFDKTTDTSKMFLEIRSSCSVMFYKNEVL